MEISNPLYIDGDPDESVLEILKKFYSNSEIKRKIKENAVKVGRPHLDEIWIKYGKQLFVVQKNYSQVATSAQIWWEYHYELMPKKIEWEAIS